MSSGACSTSPSSCRLSSGCKRSHGAAFSSGDAEIVLKSAGDVVVNDVDIAPENSDKKKKQKDTCGICLDEIQDHGTLDSCNHLFCFPCIETWLKRSSRCPMCKKVVGSVVSSRSGENKSVERRELRETLMNENVERLGTILQQAVASSRGFGAFGGPVEMRMMRGPNPLALFVDGLGRWPTREEIRNRLMDRRARRFEGERERTRLPSIPGPSSSRPNRRSRRSSDCDLTSAQTIARQGAVARLRRNRDRNREREREIDSVSSRGRDSDRARRRAIFLERDLDLEERIFSAQQVAFERVRRIFTLATAMQRRDQDQNSSGRGTHFSSSSSSSSSSPGATAATAVLVPQQSSSSSSNSNEPGSSISCPIVLD